MVDMFKVSGFMYMSDPPHGMLILDLQAGGNPTPTPTSSIDAPILTNLSTGWVTGQNPTAWQSTYPNAQGYAPISGAGDQVRARWRFGAGAWTVTAWEPMDDELITGTAPPWPFLTDGSLNAGGAFEVQEQVVRDLGLGTEQMSSYSSSWSNTISAAAVSVTVADLGGAPLAFGYSGGAGSGDALSTSALTTLAGDKLLIAVFMSYNGAQTSAVVTAKDGSATNIPLTLIDSTATSGNERLDLYRSTSSVSAGTAIITVDPSGSVKEGMVEVVAIRNAAAGGPTAHTPEKRTITNPNPISVDESLSCPANGVIISAVGFPSSDPHVYATGTKLGEQTISYRMSVGYRSTSGTIGITGQPGGGPGYSDIHIIATSWGP